MPDTFTKWIKRPESLAGVTAEQLVQSLEKYPYFATPRMLLAKHRSLAGDPAYQDAVHRAAVFVGDRTRFRDWLEGSLFTELPSETIAVEAESERPEVAGELETVGNSEDAASERSEDVPSVDAAQQAEHAVDEPDEFSRDEAVEELHAGTESAADSAEATSPAEEGTAIDTAGEAAHAAPSTFEDDGQSRSFSEWMSNYLLESRGSTAEVATGGIQDKHADTHQPEEAFSSAEAVAAEEAIERDHGQLLPLADTAAPVPEPRPMAPAEDMDVLDAMIRKQRDRAARQSAHSAHKEDGPAAKAGAEPLAEGWNDPLTETYAGILAAQGKRSRAIAIYEALSLKNPEKSGYFADLIAALEKGSESADS